MKGPLLVVFVIVLILLAIWDGGMEADCHVEERAPQPTGVVYLRGHLQHRGHFAHPLHPVFPKDRAAGFGGQNVSRPGGLPA